MRTRTLVAGALIFASTPAAAHIALRYPPPRTTEQKAGPCGSTGSTRGATVTTFTPGQKITVEWDETVDHPGHYRIAFDDDGNDVFVNPNNPNDNFPSTLVEPIADKTGGHYTQEVTLPNITCDNCTLQLMQIMTTQVPYNSFYYQCADITLAGDTGGGGGGGDNNDPVDGGCSTGGPT
ncbi:MAG: lytic polysaccharide monooxygenase, partial [Deltaproteobacteria bacterium]|nr:lytic polysaccharide monooxygenase [Deltaproteobacteria bacterium]